MTEKPRIFTKPSQTCEPKSGTVNHEGGGTIHPTLGGGCMVSPGMACWDTPSVGSAR
jgi:hypothetical protein